MSGSADSGATVAGSVALDGWDHSYSGKVRDLYTSSRYPGRVLMVASDRVSAFDHLLEPPIPQKGELLTTLSLWWFGQLDGVANHLVSREESDAAIPEAVAGRSMLVKTLDMYPIECVVRGYLSGSGWIEYQRTQSVCGVILPAGLSDGDRLPEPIYTPAWKAPYGEHDENISFERTVEIVGLEVAAALRDASLSIFGRASAIAESRGVILADTKFEFGADTSSGLSEVAQAEGSSAPRGVLTLGDEVLTSDSSRYWDAAVYASGDRTASFDKQIVRNWLLGNWEPKSASGESNPPPVLPPEIVEQTAARYRELIERLTAS